MADIVLGCDTNSNDTSVMDKVYQGLQNAGHNVRRLEIGPSPFSRVAYTNEAKGKIGIYLMADSLLSFADGYSDLYDLDIFVIRGGVGGGINSQEDFNTKPLGRDADCNSACDGWEGLTYPQMNEKANGKCVAIYGGTTPEEALQAAIDALNGKGILSGGPQNTTSGGSAVLIPDKTFFGLIKQIIGAVDAVFIIANNMAYLLSFKQLYYYRDKYEDYILKLNPSDILVDSVTRSWAVDGFYNSVEVEYSGGIIKYQHDALVNVYGENTFYYSFPNDDEETAKAKANALLSAHVRDYSTDLQLNCIYNPNITVGSWVKIPKTLTKVSGATSKTTGELDKSKTEEKKVRKGVTIENIISTMQKDASGKAKTIQKITTSDNKTYDIEVSNDDYEIYFVQGYKMRWTPKQSPIMSLHLKYGPDTPEDPVNATIGTGEITTTTGGGGFGDDCFYICEIMPNNNERIGEHGPSAPDLHKAGFEPQEQHYKPRCKAGSNLAKDMAGKTPQEVHNAVRAKFGYCKYGDSSSLWPCVSDMWDQACGTNCGDGARALKCGLDAINIKSWGVHVVDHYFVAAEINGEWVCLDATGPYEWSNTAGWPAGPKPDGCCEPNQQETGNTC